jgi:hypothetical protein
MLTRKRQKVQDVQDQLNLQTYQVFNFNPILECAAQFLHLRECAKVSNLSRNYHNKTWLYVLHSFNRFDDIIRLNSNSFNWIKKYQFHLKYQKLEFSGKFDLSSFHITDIKHVRFINYDGEFPNITNVEELFIVVYCNSNLNIFSTCPNSIKTLRIQGFFPFNGDSLPFLPNLETFECESYMFNMEQTKEKFPNMTTLHVVKNGTWLMNQFSYFKHRITIESKEFTATDVFLKFQCHELDLSKCPNIRDYSGVAHIPIVKK